MQLEKVGKMAEEDVERLKSEYEIMIENIKTTSASELEKRRENLRMSPSAASMQSLSDLAAPTPVATAVAVESPFKNSSTTSSSVPEIRKGGVHSAFNARDRVDKDHHNKSSGFQNRDLMYSGVTPSKQANRSVLLSKADDDTQTQLAHLREENANLNAAYLEVKEEIALILEQEGSLKENIRDLENSLAREKECNASDRKVNMDYLLNIMQRFLITDNKEEKCKLVPVICSILHFGPDDTQQICKKWVFNRRGLLGLLLPLPPPEVIDSDNPQMYDPHRDAIGNYGSY